MLPQGDQSVASGESSNRIVRWTQSRLPVQVDRSNAKFDKYEYQVIVFALSVGRRKQVIPGTFGIDSCDGVGHMT